MLSPGVSITGANVLLSMVTGAFMHTFVMKWANFTFRPLIILMELSLSSQDVAQLLQQLFVPIS